MADKAAVFAAVLVALYVAHEVGDHWIQTHRQAMAKGQPGWTGHRACAAHVATLTMTKATTLTLIAVALGLHLLLATAVAGLAVDAVSHYWADRRTTLARLAHWLGKGGFYTLGAPRPGHDDQPVLGTGAYALDQSWHIGWLFIAALIIAI
jgi:Protein of unknown function (DUF3307)